VGVLLEELSSDGLKPGPNEVRFPSCLKPGLKADVARATFCAMGRRSGERAADAQRGDLARASIDRERNSETPIASETLLFPDLEPLLGPLKKLKLKNIDWVIVGGESGQRARPMDPAWVTDIRDQCTKAGVAFFFKQWGGKNKKKAGRVLDGKTYSEMPETASVVPVARVARTARSSLA
jgi:protein gp37